MSTNNPTGNREKTDRDAPPIGETVTRDDRALQPTERRDDAGAADRAREQELRSKVTGLAPGRIVSAVLRGGYNPGQSPITRPAMVVSLAEVEIGVCNLQIFTDGENDRSVVGGRSDSSVVWVTAYQFSETGEPGTWHWPQRA
jgi:hypothetical protein